MSKAPNTFLLDEQSQKTFEGWQEKTGIFLNRKIVWFTDLEMLFSLKRLLTS